MKQQELLPHGRGAYNKPFLTNILTLEQSKGFWRV